MRAILLATVASLAFAGSASAIIVSGTVSTGGSFIKLGVPFTESTPDNTVGDDNFNDSNLYGFDEDQNTTVMGGDLSVDLLAATNAPGTLADGTVVASHYVFFDPACTTESCEEINGTVTFDARIVAVIFSTDNLNASDYLANNSVIYLNPALRGAEANDVYTLVDDFTLSFNTFASTPGDYVRVLTEFSPGGEVPAPATIALLGLGLVGLGLRRAR